MKLLPHTALIPVLGVVPSLEWFEAYYKSVRERHKANQKRVGKRHGPVFGVVWADAQTILSKGKCTCGQNGPTLKQYKCRAILQKWTFANNVH